MKTIPFKSELLYLPIGNEGFFAAGLMQSGYYFPNPTALTSQYFSKEYLFLDKYFFGDNYEMFLSDDEKNWTWKGLNRDVKEIIFTRIK